MADVDDRLWATPLDEQRRRDAEAEPARVEPPPPAEAEDPEPPAPEPEPPAPAPVRRADLRPLVGIALIALAVGIGLAFADRGTLGLTTPLDSAWAPTAMVCETARFEDGPRAVELFSCRAKGNGELPAGLYGPPNSSWDSDVDRTKSRDSRIEITRDGQLTGWATY